MSGDAFKDGWLDEDDGFDEDLDDDAVDELELPPGRLLDAEAPAILAYRALDEQDRFPIQLLSLACMTLSPVELLRVLQHGTLPGHRETPARVGHRLARLATQGLLQSAGAGTYRCAPGVEQLALREVATRPDLAALLRAIERALPAPLPTRRSGVVDSPRATAQALRAIRLAIVNGDEKALLQAHAQAARQGQDVPPRATLLTRELGIPFDPGWLRARPAGQRDLVLHGLLRGGLIELVDVSAAVDEAWLEWRARGPELTPWLRQTLVAHLLLRDRVADAQAVVLNSDDGELLACAGWVDLALGEVRSACAFFEQGLHAIAHALGGAWARFDGLAAVMHPIALLARGTDADLERLLRVAASTGSQLAPVLQPLVDLAQRWRWPGAPVRHRRASWAHPGTIDSPLMAVLASWTRGLAVLWSAEIPDEALLTTLHRHADRCRALGLPWLADQLADLHHRLAPGATSRPELDPAAAALPLAALVPPRPTWVRALEALVAVGRSEVPGATPARRLAWYLSLDDSPRLRAREQRWTARGRYSAGRAVGSARLVTLATGELDLDPRDLELCRALRAAYQDHLYGLEPPLTARVARALVGHPRVHWADQPTTAIEVVWGQVELHVQRRADGGVRLHLVPAIAEEAEAAILREGPTRAQVIEVNARQRAIGAILGEGLDLPAAAEARTLEALGATAAVIDVRSDLELPLEGIEEQVADARPRARIAFAGRALQLELVVTPLGEGGPVFVPGLGPATVVSTVAGQRLRTRRDLDEEARRVAACLETCPVLAAALGPEQRASLTDPQRSLELLAELRALGEAIVLEWSTEGRMRVRAEVGLSRLRLRVGKGRDWFALQGELRVDDDLVLDMRRLLELSALVPGRFVPLGDGAFLALSVELRRRLDALRDLTQDGRDGLRVHALAAAAVEQALQGIEAVERSAEFTARLAELEQALRAEPPLPRDLQLELRGYQREGYTWLARLAAAGLGACLADDMGLGKTAQVLALLLTLRERGPALVVAPTSVIGTWREQAARYAPALRVVELATGDRTATMASLGPGDVLLCSYALLLREAEALRQVDLACAVLDEAQAVKNAATKRWKAATGLRARARVITTGTPVENHLSELWSLFTFINPGLLGTREDFEQHFAVPVERDRDRERLGHLKALIAPYVLRRTKSQVLTELPPRTEINLEIEMGTAERAHYEALRQRALERLTQPTHGSAQPGHVRILAEITRLRRACSNPAMISPEASLPSCKLEACVELLEELRRGDHRTLVFSQWLDQLAALQQRLDALGFRQLYLDGATPTDERQRRIEAFQAGQAEVFLISLRAGGQGINLTAADYVVHVDPWWNPAVEDQASDRAHRLGQTRPVTVYRLIVKDSIEQKILALHRDKRDLASQILAGGEVAAKLSADELLDLIRLGG